MTKPAAAIALVTCLIASAGHGAPVTEKPVFSSDVALVLLPVFVVDRGGQAVGGLGAEDFQLYEDGKRVDVVSFRHVDTTSVEEQETLRQATAARRRFLLLFDRSFTDPAGLRRAQKAAVDFVRAGLAPSDLAAVATFDVNQGIKLVANFTEDRVLLAHAVESLGVAQLARISDPLALAADLGALDVLLPGPQEQANTNPDLAGGLVVLMNRMRAAEVEAQRASILTLVESFNDLARALRGVEGRKQVLYFSSGFDSRLLIGQGGEDQKRIAESSATGRLWEIDEGTRFGDTRLRNLLKEMTRAFTTADAVIHSVDVSGLGRDSSLTQQYATVDPHRDTGGRESLNLLAAETGGRFYKDTNNLGPVLDEMLAMTSRYYVLGFQPGRAKAPGAFHKISVKIDRKGVRVSHRPGYHEREPLRAQRPLQRQFETAQLILGGGANDLGISTLLVPLPAPGRRQQLGIVIQVPQRALLPGADGQVALEVYAYAMAPDGTAHGSLAQMARLDPARAAADVLGVSFFGSFDLLPGQYQVRVLVRDADSGRSGVVVNEVAIPARDMTSAYLVPPMVADDPARWHVLEMTRGRGERPSLPFQAAGQPFVPRAGFDVEAGVPSRVVLITYSPPAADPAADVHIRSSLVDAKGAMAPAGLLRIKKVHRDPGGRRTYVLEYTPDALAPGDYTLRVAIGEEQGRVQAYTRMRVLPRS